MSKDNPAATISLSDNGHLVFLCRPLTERLINPCCIKEVGSSPLKCQLYSGEQADRGYLHAYSLSFDYLGGHSHLR